MKESNGDFREKNENIERDEGGWKNLEYRTELQNSGENYANSICEF